MESRAFVTHCESLDSPKSDAGPYLGGKGVVVCRPGTQVVNRVVRVRSASLRRKVSMVRPRRAIDSRGTLVARHSNNPKRRIAPPGSCDLERLRRKARYVGSAHHKTRPADYCFDPPTAPRPHKSVCDDIRIIKCREARRLLRSGIARGMVSRYRVDGLPKYIWAVDEAGEVYEAKLDANRAYHGYRLRNNDQAMRRLVTKEWRRR